MGPVSSNGKVYLQIFEENLDERNIKKILVGKLEEFRSLSKSD